MDCIIIVAALVMDTATLERRSIIKAVRGEIINAWVRHLYFLNSHEEGKQQSKNTRIDLNARVEYNNNSKHLLKLEVS